MPKFLSSITTARIVIIVVDVAAAASSSLNSGYIHGSIIVNRASINSAPEANPNIRLSTIIVLPTE
jgi:hypothetical protein